MKRILPFILIILLLFLGNSCGGIPLQNPTLQALQATMSQVAESWTPIPTQTANPYIPLMVNWLNVDLSTVNTLEKTMDAQYQVTNISAIDPDGSGIVYRMDIGCICMHTTDCCIPERTFVVVIEAMKRNAGTAVAQVPSNISKILIVCYDHTKGNQVGSISALWQDVRDYLLGNTTGYQLGGKVVRTIAP